MFDHGIAKNKCALDSNGLRLPATYHYKQAKECASYWPKITALRIFAKLFYLIRGNEANSWLSLVVSLKTTQNSEFEKLLTIFKIFIMATIWGDYSNRPKKNDYWKRFKICMFFCLLSSSGMKHRKFCNIFKLFENHIIRSTHYCLMHFFGQCHHIFLWS